MWNYQYYQSIGINLLKIGEVEISPKQEAMNELEVEKKNYKVALKSAKEQPIKNSVKETHEAILNDNTIGKGMREKKKNSKYL